MTNFLEILAVMAVTFAAFWAFLKLLQPRAPADPAEDPDSDVPVRRGTGPKGRSGAVAVEEPDDENLPDAYPPRNL